MADLKQFLDFPGLEEYDRLLKEYIKTGSTDEIEKVQEDLAELASYVGEASIDEKAATGLTAQVEANKAAIDILNGDKDTAGSVAKSVNDAIAELVAGAPEALDTLKEIADWIADDESGAATLVSRVNALEQADEDLKEYVDAQDVAYYNLIQRIQDVKINSLFPIAQAANETATAAIANLAEGAALTMTADQTVAEDITIDKDCYIDANGSTFTGTITIPADKEVVIENATFSNPVVVA